MQGGRSKKHLQSNIEALSLRLSLEEMEQIEDAGAFDWDFPAGFLFRGARPVVRNMKPGMNYLNTSAVHIDSPAPRAPILPAAK